MKKGYRLLSELLLITMLCGCNTKKVVEEKAQETGVTIDVEAVEDENPTTEPDEAEQKEADVTVEPTPEVTTEPEVTKEPEVVENTTTTQATPEATEEPVEEPNYEHGALIEDQTFEVELDGWGQITFASYLPKDENDDVTFLFLQNGEIVNCLEDGSHAYGYEQDKFVSVEAIAFKDCNQDDFKDIITIIQYERSDKSTYNTVRVYTCHDISVEFQRDLQMEEYIAKQHATDSIQAVMNCLVSYPDYQYSLLETDIRMQLEIIADHVEEWTDLIEEQYQGFYYTVTDLNHNGRLELIATICEGSGLYSINKFYEIDEALDDLVVVQYVHDEVESEPDLTYFFVPVYHDPSNDTYCYIFNDLLRSGAMEYYTGKYAISIDDDKIVQKFLAGKTYYYGDEDEVQIDCKDADGNEITEIEYESMEQSFYTNYESGVAAIDWKRFESVEEVANLGRKELLHILVDSYSAFETIWE